MAQVKIQTTLSNEDVREAVSEWLKQKGLFGSDDKIKVELNVKTETRGYGMHEQDFHVVEVVAIAERSS